MILFKTPKLRTCDGDLLMPNTYQSITDGDTLWLCVDGVLEYFAIPNTARKFQFVAHNRPAVDRVPVTYQTLFTETCIRVDGTKLMFNPDTKGVIKHLVDKYGGFYVECWYEE